MRRWRITILGLTGVSVESRINALIQCYRLYEVLKPAGVNNTTNTTCTLSIKPTTNVCDNELPETDELQCSTPDNSDER